MFSFTVDDLVFQDWVLSLEYGFKDMLETMIRVAEEVKKETQFRTPVSMDPRDDPGKLSRSFKWTVVTDNSRFKVLQIQMSALNTRTGYDYAMTQHRGYHTSKSGWKVWYNHHATDLGFSTYRKWYDGTYSEGPSGDWKSSGWSYDSSKYMYWGIKYAENSAFEMIETDYLSMFNRSFIV